MVRPFYLLDTNILSEAIKPLPDLKVKEKIDKYVKISAIPAVAWCELLSGLKKMPDGRRKNLINDYLYDTVQVNYEIIPFDNHAAFIASDITSRLEPTGKTIPQYDLMIAATAVANNMILVTRNTKDFEPIQAVSPLLLENWF